MTKRFLPLLAFLALAGCSGPNNKAEIKLATPSPQQIDFMNNEIGAFFHFTTNTFTGAEHGDGTATPADFNPTKLDVDQWMEAAKSLGAKYAVLTARHEDGFCLWPTKTTEYATHRGKTAGATSSKSSSRRAAATGSNPDSISPRTTTDTKYSNPRTGRSSGGKCGTVLRICAGRIRHSSKNTASWKWTRSPNC